MEARYLTDLEWRICHAVNIYVYRNGRDGEQPVLVHIPPSKKKNMRTVMNVVQERVKYPVGYAKFLYKMDGTRIKDPCELEMYNNYVVASNFEKHFKCAAYGRKRSPLLVLNRESKHVRVLKLQNQNYYEWLLKKKTVGEERPPYIYPAIYSNDNYGPQDLPLGQMGNYHPPIVDAAGCCYPRADGGNKTYRVNGQNKYVVNTVTVDVTPDLAAMREIPRERRDDRRHANKHSKYRGKFLEQTPSDMLNANVVVSADSASQEGASVGTSETEDQMKIAKKIRASKHKRSKSHRLQLVTSEEYHHEQQCVNVIETTSTPSQTSEDARRLQKSLRKAKRDKERLLFPEPSAPPPPPAQFRDNKDFNNNAQQLVHQHPDSHLYKDELLKYVDRAIHNSNSNFAPGQKSFYYSPDKLAEINSCGNIQPFELAFTQPQQPGNPGQWTLIQQPQQQQMFQQVYAIKSQPTTVFPVQTLDASSINSQQRPPPPQEVISSYPPQQNPPIMQNIQVPPSFQSIHNSVPVMHAISSQPVFQQPNPQPTQCMMIPNNTNLTPIHQQQQQVQSQLATNVNLIPSPQLAPLQNHNSSNPLQQVYQLGIIQQPNPQTCIQVDAKAMRQYVDNQKLIENRYLHQVNDFEGPNEEFQQERHRAHHHQDKHNRSSHYKQHHHHTDVTESELDIPFTPLKTYRLNNNLSSSRVAQQNPMTCRNCNRNQIEDGYDRCPNSLRNERLPIKVKSRNVAIQMGYPGASARSGRGNNFIDSHAGSSMDIAFAQDRRNLIFNPRDYSNLSLMERTPRSGRGLYERFLTPSKDRTIKRGNNFGSSYSDQYVNLRTSRNNRYPVAVNSLIRPEKVGDKSSEMNLHELVTIAPPNEFRELEAAHFSRHTNNTKQQSSNMFSRRNNPYYCTNNDRSESTSQYMHSHYP